MENKPLNLNRYISFFLFLGETEWPPPRLVVFASFVVDDHSIQTLTCIVDSPRLSRKSSTAGLFEAHLSRDDSGNDRERHT